MVQDICCQIENEQLAKIYLVTFHQNVTSKQSFHENIPSFFSLSTTFSNKSKVKELQKFIDLQRYGLGVRPNKPNNTEASSSDKRISIWRVFDEPAYLRMGPRATGRQLSHKMRLAKKEP